MIPVTADALEQIAFTTGATIHLRPTRAYCTTGGVTYGAVLTCPARLSNGPLACTRPAGHADGHTFAASDAPDRHTEGVSDQ